MGQSFIASALVIAASTIIGAVSLGGIRAQQSLEPVSVIVFPGGFNWPIWVAQDKGYFASSGIEVNLTNTPNSVFQLTNLIEGKFDIAMTAIDNVIAYMERQGEAPTQVKPDLIVFMGGDNGFLSLVTVPEVRNVNDLKGRTVSVDARTTGYAFVLFDLMKRKGLNEADYKVEKAGGVLQRWDALKEKKHDGTLLLTPFDFIAKANGFNVLEYAIDVYGHYQGLVGASRRAWAADNPHKVQAFIKGYAS
ncbi:MAG TPA: ABC transporter substrate-binding protein, partial [Terracidiphilus sp.]|nr:ABC transporter substrate-binding protein [Terracidiphilus sp.]